MKVPVIYPDILLPKANCDYQKWAVVAVDQFTSSPSYWQELDYFVGGAPSSLRCTIPELYLSQDNSERIADVNANMHKYLNEDMFDTHKNCAVLIERSTPYNPKRLGIVVAIDLEHYDYRHENKPLIRATEGTILERIPPRVEIRKNAPLEIPHVILLIDDIDRTVIEPLQHVDKTLLYNFELNMGGGSIKGYKIEDTNRITLALEKLLQKNGDFLFAVGDGNHSLATAKVCWESLKSQGITDHPARYALVEIENIYDEGIIFEPIHRAVIPSNDAYFINELKSAFEGCTGKGYTINNGMVLEINLPASAIEAVAGVQAIVDRWVASGAEVDYIHGKNELIRLGKRQDVVCVELPPMDKSELFSYVARFGSLPRKTFSMGEGVEKRYYIESRKIVS